MSIDGNSINVIITNIWLHLIWKKKKKIGNALISHCFCSISLFAFIDVFRFCSSKLELSSLQQKDTKIIVHLKCSIKKCFISLFGILPFICSQGLYSQIKSISVCDLWMSSVILCTNLKLFLHTSDVAPVLMGKTAQNGKCIQYVWKHSQLNSYKVM